MLGKRAYQDFRVINLWEVDVNLDFTQNLDTLLPFVPVLSGDNQEPIIQKAVCDTIALLVPASLDSLLDVTLEASSLEDFQNAIADYE